MAQPSAAATAPSTPTDQRVRLALEAEIFQDDEGGPDSLIVTTDELTCEPIAPARLLGLVADARARLDQMERLAREYEARDTLRAIIAEHDLQVEEWDLADLDAKWRNKFMAFTALLDDGRRILVVPQGQDPIKRVNAVAALVNDLQAQT
jgi:hypothetical protein